MIDAFTAKTPLMSKNRPSFKKPLTLLMVGLVFSFGPLFGMMGTVLGMVRAFGHLGEGAYDAETTASHISLAMVSALIGWAVTPVGLACVIGAMVWIMKIHNRSTLSDR